MAIIGYQELPDRRRGSFRAGGQYNYSRVFAVTTDTDRNGVQQVVNYLLTQLSVGLGSAYQIGAPADAWYEVDPVVYLQGIDAEPSAEDTRTWHVTLNYGPYTPELAAANNPPIGQAPTPVGEPPSIVWGSNPYRAPYRRDVEDKAIINTVLDPYDQPPERDDSRSSLVISRNELSYSETLAKNFRDKINGATWFSYAPRTVKVKDIQATVIWVPASVIAKGYYWRVTYQFEFSADGKTWDDQILNQGRRGRTTVGGPIIHLKDTEGNFLTEPVALKEDGTRATAQADFFYLTYKPYKTANFSALNIPFIGDA
jgi:hypothetical protein